MIDYLVTAQGVDIGHLDKQDRNCLYWACCDNCNRQEDSIRVIKHLLSLGVDINKASKLLRSGLSKACYLGLDEIVQFMCSHKEELGIDLDQQDNKGRTPLHNACWGCKGGFKGKFNGPVLMHDAPQCARHLISHGCDPRILDYAGCNALYSACTSEGLDTLEVLYSHGIRVDDATVDKTVYYGHWKVIQRL